MPRLVGGLLLVCLAAVRAVEQLSAGDVAVIAYNSDSPDEFAWVALKTIYPNTVIGFADEFYVAASQGDANRVGLRGDLALDTGVIPLGSGHHGLSGPAAETDSPGRRQ